MIGRKASLSALKRAIGVSPILTCRRCHQRFCMPPEDAARAGAAGKPLLRPGSPSSPPSYYSLAHCEGNLNEEFQIILSICGDE